MLNETNCDWLFDMSVKRPQGRALANKSYHTFQTFSRQGLATRDYLTYSSWNQACAVCKLLCNNCTIVKTTMQCMIKHLDETNIYFLKNVKKCPPSTPKIKKIPLTSHLRGEFIFRNLIQALNKCLKSWLDHHYKKILHNKKKALIRSVSVIISEDTAFCDRRSVIGLKNPDWSTPMPTFEQGCMC